VIDQRLAILWIGCIQVNEMADPIGRADAIRHLQSDAAANATADAVVPQRPAYTSTPRLVAANASGEGRVGEHHLRCAHHP
jgi:hypothetical protein